MNILRWLTKVNVGICCSRKTKKKEIHYDPYILLKIPVWTPSFTLEPISANWPTYCQRFSWPFCTSGSHHSLTGCNHFNNFNENFILFQNLWIHVSWRYLLVSSNPSISLTLPSSLLNHIPKHHIYFFKCLQGWWFNNFAGQLVPLHDDSFSE